MENIFCEWLKTLGIEYLQNESTARFSTFKVGGTSDLCVFPRSTEQLIAVLRELYDRKMRFEVIGNASNVLFAFEHFDGVLVFCKNISGFSFSENILVAECGASLTHIAAQAASRSLSGLEFAYGIPALVGGAVYMNAGAYGACIADVLVQSTAYDMARGEIVVIDAADHGFGYRQSLYMENRSLICLNASMKLRCGDGDKIKQKMDENISSRRSTQPLEYPSAGSYFKRPEGNFAGKLIDDCGLKGMRVGNAEVSRKHAGFIINRGGATASDILTLEDKIKTEVMSRFGIELCREVRVIK